MFTTDNFRKIEKNKNHFLLFNIIVILFTSGITFTAVIPSLKGFDLATLFIALVFYILIGNIFAGIFINKIGVVFTISSVLCSLGMGWRLWLEWGEFSLVEHTNIVVILGYPSILASIITLIYFGSEKLKTKKIIIVNRD